MKETKIALGTWAWGAGMGESERILGHLAAAHKRENVLISTKFTPQLAEVMNTVLTPEEITRLETLADAAGIDTRGDWEHTME